jgi:hypothetical protein
LTKKGHLQACRDAAAALWLAAFMTACAGETRLTSPESNPEAAHFNETSKSLAADLLHDPRLCDRIVALGAPILKEAQLVETEFVVARSGAFVGKPVIRGVRASTTMAIEASRRAAISVNNEHFFVVVSDGAGRPVHCTRTTVGRHLILEHVDPNTGELAGNVFEREDAVGSVLVPFVNQGLLTVVGRTASHVVSTKMGAKLPSPPQFATVPSP